MNSRLAILTLLMLLLLPGCGVLEIGLEEIPARETATPPPTLKLLPTAAMPPTQPPHLARLKPGQAARITYIQMGDKLNGWGIGRVDGDLNDYVLFTNDGGRSWQNRAPKETLSNPPGQGLSAIAFFDANGRAWVVYAESFPRQPLPEKLVVWRASGFGQAWQAGGEVALTGLRAEFFLPDMLEFVDEQHGWLMARLGAETNRGHIAIFATADGGQTWQRALDPERNPELMACPKTGLAFSDPKNGWLAGDCPGLMPGLFLYSTSDGGQTWQPVGLAPPAGQPADLFSGGKAGCGIPGLPYITARSVMLIARCEIDAPKRAAAWLYAGQPGETLTPRALPLPYGNLQFLNPEEGWFIGAQSSDPAAPGEIYRTLDGGQTWKLVLSTAWQGIPNFIDSNTGWVVARAGEKYALVYTSNGGVLWEEINAVIGKD